MADPEFAGFFQAGKILKIGFSVLLLVKIEKIAGFVFDGRRRKAEHIDHTAVFTTAVGSIAKAGQNGIVPPVFTAANRASWGDERGKAAQDAAQGLEGRILQAVSFRQVPAAEVNIPKGPVIEGRLTIIICFVYEPPQLPYPALTGPGGNEPPCRRKLFVVTAWG
jgi:hypothetical protein